MKELVQDQMVDCGREITTVLFLSHMFSLPWETHTEGESCFLSLTFGGRN